jgi:hypothetical protein
MSFDEQSRLRISRVVQKAERQNINAQPKKKFWPTAAGGSALTIQAPSGGIPAASNYSFGSAVCKILRSDGGTWKDTGETETIYNPSTEDECTDGLRLGWAVEDGSVHVLISKLCGDNRTFTPAEELNPDEVDPITGEL